MEVTSIFIHGAPLYCVPSAELDSPLPLMDSLIVSTCPLSYGGNSKNATPIFMSQ